MANAMYGFREMGAEIIPYHLIDDIYEEVQREDIVLDYIDQCKQIFNKFGVTPHIPDYPDVLMPFLGRKIWKDTINSNSKVLLEMVEAFETWAERPMACSMDIGVTKDGRTLLVELNDAYALGCYGLPAIYYAKLISARWSQLLGVKDEYHY
jgi:hypothetical protein